MSILTKIFSTGATALVKEVGTVVDDLITSKEEKLILKNKLKELLLSHEVKMQQEQFQSVNLHSQAKNLSSKPVVSHKIVLVGDVAVGKTCISIRYQSDKFSSEHKATIMASFLTKNVELETHTVKYEIWDTAGQERFGSLSQIYYKNATAAFVVFDITSADSFEAANKWVEELKDKAPANNK